LASAAMCIPFKRSSRIRRFPWRRRSSIILEQTMAMRKRDEEEVFPHAAGIDVGASSHWVGPLVVSCGTQQSELMVVVEPGGHVGRSLAGLSTCPRGGSSWGLS
jgi:hypothetical protein